MRQSIEAIVAARPDVFNHNLETVPRLYPTIAPARATMLAAAAGRVKNYNPADLHQVRHHAGAWAKRALKCTR